MRFTVLFATALLAGPSIVFAQSTPPTSSGTPSATDSTAPSPSETTGTTPSTAGSGSHTDAMQPGANSFTEAQARQRIEKAGYTDVRSLEKSADGVWRGDATRDGTTVRVSLDYLGNIAAM